jgi:hypothetical protein
VVEDVCQGRSVLPGKILELPLGEPCYRHMLHGGKERQKVLAAEVGFSPHNAGGGSRENPRAVSTFEQSSADSYELVPDLLYWRAC